MRRLQEAKQAAAKTGAPESADIVNTLAGTSAFNSAEDAESAVRHAYNYAREDEALQALTAKEIKAKIKETELAQRADIESGYYTSLCDAADKEGLLRFLRERLAVAAQAKKGIFGLVSDRFRGMAADAAKWLYRNKSGQASAVFHNDKLGDIDLVWGDDRGGLCHIINKHIEEHDDYNSVDEMLTAVGEAINKGSMRPLAGGARVVFSHNSKTAVVAKSEGGNFVLTSYDTEREQKDKKRSAADATLIHQSVVDEMDGTLVPPRRAPGGKDTTNSATDKEKAEENIAKQEKTVEELCREIAARFHGCTFTPKKDTERSAQDYIHAMLSEAGIGEASAEHFEWYGKIEDLGEAAAQLDLYKAELAEAEGEEYSMLGDAEEDQFRYALAALRDYAAAHQQAADAKPTLLDAVRTLYEKGAQAASKLFGMTYFEVAKTPDILKRYGLTGERFTIRYGVLSRRAGKDSGHYLPPEVWEQLPEALQSPVVITKYYTDSERKNQKGYRIYMPIRLSSGEHVVVCAVVKNAGRDIEVNAINTVFGRDAVSRTQEEVLYPDKAETPEQLALLGGNNPRQYPAGQEPPGGKGTTNSADSQENGGYNADVVLEKPETWVGRRFLIEGNVLKCTGVNGGMATFGSELMIDFSMQVSYVQDKLRKSEAAVLAEEGDKVVLRYNPETGELEEEKPAGADNPAGPAAGPFRAKVRTDKGWRTATLTHAGKRIYAEKAKDDYFELYAEAGGNYYNVARVSAISLDGRKKDETVAWVEGELDKLVGDAAHYNPRCLGETMLDLVAVLGGDAEGARKAIADYEAEQERKEKETAERLVKEEAERKAKEEAERKAKAEERSRLYRGYLDNMSPMQAARVEKILGRRLNFSDHGVMTYAEMAAKAVEELGSGAAKAGTAMSKNYKESQYYSVGPYDVPKTVYDYARYLAEQKPQTPQTPAKTERPRLVSDERMEELRRRLRAKLGGQLNVGIDPEIIAIGSELAVGYIEIGARKFADFAQRMIDDIGDAIRPYLKALYNAARDYPGMEETAEEMTPYEEVRRTDVANIGKKTVNALDAAETVVKEQEAARLAAEAKRKAEAEAKQKAEAEAELVEALLGDKDLQDAVRNSNRQTAETVCLDRMRDILVGWDDIDKAAALWNELNSKDKAVREAAEGRIMDKVLPMPEDTATDGQGNAIDKDGRLITEKIASIDDLRDEDFTDPTRSVELPELPRNVQEAIGTEGKPVVVKRNIFVKNAAAHDFSAGESRNILKQALYNTDIVGQTQPKTRGNYWVAIRLDEQSPITVLEVNAGKDNVEVVGWYRLDQRNLERIKRQAEREGGELLILTPKGAAASLSTLPSNLSSGGKGTDNSANGQTNTTKKRGTWQECLDRLGAKQGRIDLFKFADKSGERPLLAGVYHDGGGVRVATDGTMLIAVHGNADYTELKGKVTDKKGQVVEGTYPNWRGVIPARTAGSVDIDIDKFKEAVAGQAGKLKHFEKLKKIHKETYGKPSRGEYGKEIAEYETLEGNPIANGYLTHVQAGGKKWYMLTENAKRLAAILPNVGHAEMYAAAGGEHTITVVQGDAVVAIMAPVIKRSDPRSEAFDITAAPADGEENTPEKNSEAKKTVTLQAEPLSGDSLEHQRRTEQERRLVQDIADEIQRAAAGYSSVRLGDIRQMILSRHYDALEDISTTDLQELAERAVTVCVREVAGRAASADAAERAKGFRDVVRIYEAQPLLNARDSTRVELQQYSTPAPFGYLMGMFAQAGRDVESVLEPCAGNGALTTTFIPGRVRANEIDERRIANLRALGFGEITTQDALQPFGDRAYDTVMTNPPFGTVAVKVFDGLFRIASLEGQMAINALDAMTDDGRAAIIIGGNTDYRDNGAMQAKDAALFGYLYSHYNVADVINISGMMYARNGTKYPVRMILIDGRKSGEFKRGYPPVKAAARAETVTQFSELYDRIEYDLLQLSQRERPQGSVGDKQGVQQGHGGGRPLPPHTPGAGPRGGSGEHTVHDDGRVPQPVGGHDSPAAIPQPQREGAAGVRRPVRGGTGERGAGNEGRGGTPSPERVRQTAGPLADDNRGGSVGVQGGQRRDAGGSAPGGHLLGVPGGEHAVGQRKIIDVKLGAEKVPYPASSKAGTLGSVVPAGQAQAIADSLAAVGDVDEYLVGQLGYADKDELYSHLAAEQIDSVALAIRQMSAGHGFIIGDMTGIGKGRQGAALIRWAVRRGMQPVYFTQKPTLFSDCYRDLCDIGSSDLRPFIMSGNAEAAITDLDGNKIVRLPNSKERKRVYDHILRTGGLPEEYDFIITTYSQIQCGTMEYADTDDGKMKKSRRKDGKGKDNNSRTGQERRDVLEELYAAWKEKSIGNVLIMDESHTAGGDGGGAMFMRFLSTFAGGTGYMSATFAKRPENMPIYALKTAISECGIKTADMIDAIRQGGVTLQEVMSRQLAQSGQMIRRERDFTGVSVDWLAPGEAADNVQRACFDEVSSIFADIRRFQDSYVKPVVADISLSVSEVGDYADIRKGTEHLGVQNAPFASKMYNLVNQLLFAMKADAIANRAMVHLLAGRKPVIPFVNTMEGFLDELPMGEPLQAEPNFSLSLRKALDGVMRYTIKDTATDVSQYETIPLADLSEAGQALYADIAGRIAGLSAKLSISPMDAIRMKLEANGYKVGEITGRKKMLTRDAEGKYIVAPRSDRDSKKTARDFNSGALDVLLINKAGSTGISLHASTRFADRRQRVEIFAQFQSDINDEVQMRGRTDRTGQVSRSMYEYLVSSIPTEQRLQMMFKSKLKSLDANTTSSQKSKFNEMEVVDFLNKYGDEVVWEYMENNRGLCETLGDPCSVFGATVSAAEEDAKEASDRRSEGKTNKNDCAAKFMRYLAFLPVAEQEKVFAEIMEAYNTKIDLLNEAGENDLEVTELPLAATVKRRQIAVAGTNPGKGNTFADNVYLETCEVNVLHKPMKASEIRAAAAAMCDGRPWDEWIADKLEEMRQAAASKSQEQLAAMSAKAKDKAEEARQDTIDKAIADRKAGKNEFTDEEIEQFGQAAAQAVADEAEKKMIAENRKRESRYRSLAGLIAGFRPLRPLFINQVTDEKEIRNTVIDGYGTLIGIRFGSSFLPSSCTAVFATLDGRRKLTVPLSKTAVLEAIQYQSQANAYSIRSLDIDNWDSKAPTDSRTTAYILTGNLMVALARGKQGRLIAFTTKSGRTRQGVLAPAYFKPEDMKVQLPATAAFSKLARWERVSASDGVELARDDSWRTNKGYVLRVPKSKRSGGKFFEDKPLRKLIRHGEFETSGSKMVAYIGNDEETIMAVLARLAKLGVTLETESDLKDTEFNEDELLRDDAWEEESATDEGSASEPSYRGQPAPAQGSPVGAKVCNKSEAAKRLGEIIAETSTKAFGAHQFLYRIAQAMGFRGRSMDKSQYFDMGGGETLRIGDHSATADNFARHSGKTNRGVVVKLSIHRFTPQKDVDYKEYVYYPDRLDAAREKSIAEGLREYALTGNFDALPVPDRKNVSGIYRALANSEAGHMTAEYGEEPAPAPKTRIEKLLAAKPVRITGREIEPSDDMRQYKKNALEYGKTLRGSYTNHDTGVQMRLGKSGVKEVLQHDYKNIEQLQSVAAIPSIIENSIYIGSLPNEDTATNKDVVAYHYYACGLNIAGKDYTVRAVAAEQADGTRYYDHKLTQIEKGKLIDELARTGLSSPTELSSTSGREATGQIRPTDGGETPSASVSVGKDTKLFRLLKEELEKYRANSETDTDTLYSLRQEDEPAETRTGYAVFVVRREKDGTVRLLPKMLADDPGAPAGTWLNADTGHLKRDTDGRPLQNTIGRASVSVNGRQSGGVKSNKLSWRPGKHLCRYPVAAQFAGQDGRIAENVVFFEVEYAADEAKHKDYQRAAWEYGMRQNGQYDNTLGGLPYIPRDSYYIYRTNQIADGAAPMIITGAYNIRRALTDAEAKRLCEEAGGKWTPRRGGELTAEGLAKMGIDEAGLAGIRDSFDTGTIAEGNDESQEAVALPGYVRRAINWADAKLRRAIEENGQTAATYERGYMPPAGKPAESRPADTPEARARQAKLDRVRQLAAKLHIESIVDIVEDGSAYTGNKAKAKGFYSKRTGRITIVLANNTDALDIEKTLLHEAVAHYGLRKLFGERFNQFIDQVYQAADPEIRRKIAAKAAKRGWDFRRATEEYLAYLAEGMAGGRFERYSAEAGFWQKLKRLFTDFLAGAGFDGWQSRHITLGDREMEYFLWRSWQDMADPGHGGTILGQAADTAKQAELKVGAYAPQTGRAMDQADGTAYDYGRYPKGRVATGLANKRVEVVKAEKEHGFKNLAQAKAWAAQNICRTYLPSETGSKGQVSISKNAVAKYLSESAVAKSVSMDIHLAVLKVLPNVIRTSIDAEIHPDFTKANGVRSAASPINRNVLVHRLYGVVSIDGKMYRVKVTLDEFKQKDQLPSIPHSYEATKIELLSESQAAPGSTSEDTRKRPSINLETAKLQRKSDTASISGKELLKNVEMSYNPGRKLLDESEADAALGDLLRGVWHGSGAHFAAFDHSHMGEGEGAQAYGWGTYVTDVRGIAEGYAQSSGQSSVLSSIYNKYGAVIDAAFLEYRMQMGKIGPGAEHDEERKAARAKFLAIKKKAEDDIKAALANLSTENTCHLYAVEIPDDTGENYICWDKVLTPDQVEKIEKGLKRRRLYDVDIKGKDGSELIMALGLRYGGSFYHGKGPMKASKFLSSLGFVGIKYPAQYRSGGRTDGAMNFVIFKEEDARIVDEEMWREADPVNDEYNRKLDALTEENADKVVLQLGRPSAVLRAAGVADKPIRLYGSKVIKKMKKHGFSLQELRDLPKAVAAPVAVFDNYGKDGNRAILTELHTADGNILVALQVGKGETDADFNIVSSAFGKTTSSIAYWITNGKATYMDKQKALTYLHLAAPIAAASDKQELDDAAKVVENFQNPTISGQENADDDELFRDADAEDYKKALAKDIYEKKVKSGAYQAREALQDSMAGLKAAMDAVVKATYGKQARIEDVPGYMNPYLAENRLSSVNLAEGEAYKRTILRPLTEEVARLAPDADSRAALTDYMMAVHGLERNRIMRQREKDKVEAELKALEPDMPAEGEPDYKAKLLKYRDELGRLEEEKEKRFARLDTRDASCALWP